MQAIRARDTTPELEVRRRLHAAGLRYRVGVRPVPTLRRTADIVFTRRRIAIFIDGCFWHSCPAHGHAVGTNQAYWAPKLARTIARDLETTEALQAAAWTVARFWEHEDAAAVSDTIIALVRQA
jgi:DNA mismatch endonuclease (patch repair protein)